MGNKKVDAVSVKENKFVSNVQPVGKSKSNLPIFEENPFLNMNLVSTQFKSVDSGSDVDSIVLASRTSEKVTTIAEVQYLDDEQFIKIYTHNASFFLGLDKAGQKVFMILMQMVQSAINKDKVYLNLRNAEKIAPLLGFTISKTTYLRGISNLCERNVIALTLDAGLFFINPAILFNGDRADFVRSYRKIPKELSSKKNLDNSAGKNPPWVEEKIQQARAQRAKVAL